MNEKTEGFSLRFILLLAPPAGFEPATIGLEGRYSVH